MWGKDDRMEIVGFDQDRRIPFSRLAEARKYASQHGYDGIKIVGDTKKLSPKK
jgi:sugar phosphate isomerase/epimerase